MFLGVSKNEGIHQFNKQGQRSVTTTKENISKAKDKIADFKTKRAAKAAEQKKAQAVAEQNGSLIRNGAASRSPVPDVPKQGEMPQTQTGASQLIKTRQKGKKAIKTTARNAERTVKTTAKGTVKATEKGVKTQRRHQRRRLRPRGRPQRRHRKRRKHLPKPPRKQHRPQKPRQRRQPKQRKSRSEPPLLRLRQS